jgi:hypothetical protein
MLNVEVIAEMDDYVKPKNGHPQKVFVWIKLEN